MDYILLNCWLEGSHGNPLTAQAASMTIDCSLQTVGKASLLKTPLRQLIEHREFKLEHIQHLNLHFSESLVTERLSVPKKKAQFLAQSSSEKLPPPANTDRHSDPYPDIMQRDLKTLSSTWVFIKSFLSDLRELLGSKGGRSYKRGWRTPGKQSLLSQQMINAHMN